MNEVASKVRNDSPATELDPLPRLKPWTSYFYGCWRSLHRLEFPSARRHFVLHAKPPDFTDAGTHGAICNPTFFHPVCQRTENYLQSPDKLWFTLISPMNGVGFPAHDVKIFREHEPPIIAVVDENGIFIGTILERQILKHISAVLESEKSGSRENPNADLGNS